VLRQKRRAVSPYKRPDNCNGDGGNLANRYQARPISKTMMAARFCIFFKRRPKTRFPHFPNNVSRYRVCYAAWNESIRLVTRRTSDQARKGKNCQRETYLPGSASCSAFAERPRKSGGHGPGRNCCRHRRAVAPSAPCVRPRSSVAAHGRPDSIRREQLGLVGAVGGGCSRRTRARAEMFRTKADPTKRELQDDPAPGRTTKTQDLKDHSHHT